MAIATRLYVPKVSKFSILLKPLHLSKALLYRLWWHTKAYSVILGVIVLTGLSLLALYLEWQYRQLVKAAEAKQPQPTRAHITQ